MKVILTKPYRDYTQRMIVTMPLGLLYLASYLNKNNKNIDVEIIDPDLFEGGFDDFIHVIAGKKPAVIGISMFSSLMNLAQEMMSKLKTVVPNAVIVAGGSHINCSREASFVHLPNADYAIFGDGERGLLAFCNQISSEGKIVKPDLIPGLVYRSNSTVASTSNAFLDDIDEFDPIDLDLIDIQTYFSSGSPTGLFHKGKNVAQILTTRGCPFSCTFCSASLNMGKKVRKRSTMNIVREIEDIITRGGDEIHIMDDNLTFRRDHVIDLCREVVNRKIKVNFCTPNGVRLDKLDEEMLVWMKRAGWYHLGFGIEVGSDEALKKVRKNITMAKIKEKLDLVKKVGFTTTGFFILGLPHDTVDTIKAVGELPDKMGLDMASFGNFTPLPGTVLYDELIKNGEIDEGYVPSFSSGEVTYSPPGIRPEQLIKLQRNTVWKYWLHPRRIKLVFSLLKLKDIIYVVRRLYLISFRPRSSKKAYLKA
jgi:radical SAM superfamily enzyme YgiQ (UPF0313 family)